MDGEIVFTKLDYLSEFYKIPTNMNIPYSFIDANKGNVIYIPYILQKNYIISKFVGQVNFPGYLVSVKNNQCELEYLTLLLNSGAFRYEHLKTTNPNTPLNITLPKLKNFNIPNISLTLQSKLGHISNQFFLYKTTTARGNDRYFELKASFFGMLCDAMVFQLYHSILFRENNIDLIGNIDILFPTDSFLDFEQMFKILSSESNALIDNAKAFSHYFQSVAEKHKK